MVVYVEFDSFTESTSDDPQRNDTSTHWEINGVTRDKPHRLSRHADYRSLDLGYEVTPGSYYLVYAVYSTGDSYSRQDAARIEFVDLYRTYEEAKACREILETTSKNKPAVTLKTSCGADLRYCLPWHGYFENLDFVQVKTVTL